MHELIDIPLDALQSHLASGDTRYPIMICISVAVAGLILMARGARLTPFLAATVLTVVGWFIGAASATATGLPYWPSTMVGGAIGLILGVVLVRFWVALLLSGVFAGIGLTVYAINVLPPHLKEYAEAKRSKSSRCQDQRRPPRARASLMADDGSTWSITCPTCR